MDDREGMRGSIVFRELGIEELMTNLNTARLELMYQDFKGENWMAKAVFGLSVTFGEETQPG